MRMMKPQIRLRELAGRQKRNVGREFDLLIISLLSIRYHDRPVRGVEDIDDFRPVRADRALQDWMIAGQTQAREFTPQLSLLKQGRERPSAHGSDALFGTRIGSIAFAAYAPAQLAASNDYRDARWIGLADPLQATSAGSWIATNIPAANVTLRVDSLLAARDLAASGAGVAFLPCYLGDTSPKLRRLESIEPSLLNKLWIVSHKDLRGTARVHRFITECGDYLKSIVPLLQGTAARTD